MTGQEHAAINLLYLLSAVGPAAVVVVGWLLKRAINNLDASIREARTEADGAQAIATTALQRVEVLQAAGPFQTVAMCGASHRQEKAQYDHVSTTLGEIKGLLQAQRKEDREDRERLWGRVDEIGGRLLVVEKLLERSGKE